MSGSPTNVLLQMTQQTPTTLWCDSCDPDEVAPALDWGAIGATSNPPLVLAAVSAHRGDWAARGVEIAAAQPGATEVNIAWQLLAEQTVQTAQLLRPAFDATGGVDGRMAIQVDPNLYRDAAAMADQAAEFFGLAPNLIVKIPVTAAGVVAIEEATYRGVTILGTVQFTVAQAVAVAEAVERGIRRRDAEGLDSSGIHPGCAIMVGRLDDWLKAVVDRDKVIIDPGDLEWAGVAVFKRAYEIYTERGYRTRLMSAAFRNHMQWSEFIGGAVTISPPFGWQKKYIASDITVEDRIARPVNRSVVASLYDHLEDFRKAYEPDGLAPEEFVDFGATRRTLRQFQGAISDLSVLVRDAVLPEPIKKN
jgi:transaldolase